MATPEKLSLWDRFFNRYRTVIKDRGSEVWFRTEYGIRIPNADYRRGRDWIEYIKIDRLTGSETLIRKYLN
jgi:hypothetical protein